MPITIVNKFSQNISIAVWQITETEEFFFNFLVLLPDDESRIKKIKLQKVRLQKLACRMALSKLLGSNHVEITYSETGQPLLQDYYISFSHTKNAVAVALAQTPVGIDIEELTPRILPLYPRFMNQQEIAACNVNNLNELYYYWCAKEAMYKWFAQKNLNFTEDLLVIKNEKKGMVCKSHQVQLMDFYFDNQLIVVALS